MSVKRKPAIDPGAEVLALVARLCRQSLANEPPYRPRHVDRHGSALVDVADLAALARAHRAFLATLPAPGEDDDDGERS